MDRNTILAIVLCFGVYSLWLSYQATRELPLTPINATQQEDPRDDANMTQYDDAGIDATRHEAPIPSTVSARHAQVPVAQVPVVPDVAAWEGVFEGETFSARLTNRGGALIAWTLKDFAELDDSGGKGAQVELVSLDERTPRALEMSFDSLGFGDLGSAVYDVESRTSNSVTFRLVRGGVEIRKSYTLDPDPDSYGFELFVEVRNGSDRLIAPDFAIQWPAVARAGNDYEEQSLIALHGEDVEKELLGGVGQAGFFDGLFGNGGEEEVWRDVVWAGVDLKYFVALLLPSPSVGVGTRVDFEAREPGKSAATVLRFSAVEIAPGQTLGRRWTAFLGPKESGLLESVGSQVYKSIDLGYSWFEPLTRFFQWLLEACYGFVPNYGWSIIFITILVRILTLPILNKQMRSMEKMRALQPRLKELQAEFADDRQKQSEATMALYKESGVNPLGGCFPMLLQFPVFIGLFFALKSSFALRQAPFMLWINDLSAPEVLFVIPGLDFPLRILPLVMGGSMVLQQKLTPTTIDPSQQKMMLIMMPVMMTVLFYQFPSGLVLYWMISNFLGIAHQMVVGRRMKQNA
ncbi:MAG: membrane protein insertase YidC [Myxococcota bacterium]